MCKQFLAQNFVFLSSPDSNLYSKAFHNSMKLSDVKDKVLWGENIVSNENVSYEIFD